MIVLGLLCFIYASFGSEKSNQFSEKAQNSVRKKQGKVLEDRLFNVKYKDSKNPLIEKKVMEERNIPEVQMKTSSEIPSFQDISKSMPSPIVVLEEKPESVKLNSKVEIEFHLEGVLYQDQGKKIPFDWKNLKEKQLPENLFADFKRIGPGLLCEEGKKFIFKVNNANYYYDSEDLDQIVFFDEALVFIPSNPEIDIPVFFTDGIEEFRQFLRERSEEKI